MRNFDDIVNTWFDVVIIGGGATGAGILRDLSLRGLKAILFERGDMASGASSHYHGLLHGGGRYAVTDPVSARECAEENKILRRIASHAIEPTGGLFVRMKSDDPAFEEKWVEGCREAGVEFSPVTIGEAFALEPGLSKDAVSAYRVADCAVDGFRLVWQNLYSARKAGGEFRSYAKVTEILRSRGKVSGVKIADTTIPEVEAVIPCGCVVNATGSWAKETAATAGLDIPIEPDKGAMLVYNHRFCGRVINRLREPADGDIFVPHGSAVIFGTTSSIADSPDDCEATKSEAAYLEKLALETFPELSGHRILRAYAGTRPLYTADHDHIGRAASRDFRIIDHEGDGLLGFVSVFGGKLTTYRLMAEKVSDIVAKKFFINKKSETASQELLESMTERERERGAKVFPEAGLEAAYDRLGTLFDKALKAAEREPWKRELLCECELVTYAEYETAAELPSSVKLSDVRRRTRMGMGTCQGSFCGYRGLAVIYENGLNKNGSGDDMLRDFVSERWRGVAPVMRGLQAAEAELTRNIYLTMLNIAGTQPDEREVNPLNSAREKAQ